MKYQKILLDGRNSFLVGAGKNVGQKAVPMLVLWPSLMRRDRFRPSFEPLLDRLSDRHLIAQSASALFLLKAPIQFSRKGNRGFLQFYGEIAFV